MRSRYTAYTLHNIDYLESTLHPSERGDFDKDSTTMWARDSTWLGLEILNATAGAAGDKTGSVEFKAAVEQNGVRQVHHEVSRFRKSSDSWYYHGGKEIGVPQFRRETPKVGRNDPCPCGSGKKYKKCCGI